ncbi:hypothetical protein X798_05314 [Onchocerca flexuosa]|uniref:RUN domain-containing protein n=2 Tax=Onchocerca flexuosa TaxID=387005 RepID=A0A183HKW0_9BILA|nr:hypothetical protein X798_05314 [Onchocerca flexuosa]VDO54090.1 unnamed protein product [Onchocerca flexuosa]
MLSQIGGEKCSSTLVDLVLYSENDEIVGKQSLTNNFSTLLSSSGIKRKHQNGVKYSGDESSQKLLRTLQEKFTSSKRFSSVLVLRGKNRLELNYWFFNYTCDSSKLVMKLLDLYEPNNSLSEVIII